MKKLLFAVFLVLIMATSFSITLVQYGETKWLVLVAMITFSGAIWCIEKLDKAY